MLPARSPDAAGLRRAFGDAFGETAARGVFATLRCARPQHGDMHVQPYQNTKSPLSCCSIRPEILT